MNNLTKFKFLSETFDSRLDLSIHLTTPEELKRIELPVKKIYLGHETCELKLFNIPSSEIYDLSHKKGYQISWLTPPVKEFFWGQFEKWLQIIIRLDPELEITINDLGVLHYLKKNKIKCTLILGRLLHKQIKDLRYYQMKNADINSLDLSWPVNDFYFQKFLKNNHIQRVSFDNIPYLKKWINNDNQAHFKGTLFFPFVMLTTGKNCLLKNVGVEIERNCSTFCQNFELEINKFKSMPMLLKNNALQYQNLMIDPSLWDKGIDQVVVPYWWLENDY